MKPTEIKVGEIYEGGRRNNRRRVEGVVPGNGGTMMVRYTNLVGKRTWVVMPDMNLVSFARWAHRRLDPSDV